MSSQPVQEYTPLTLRERYEAPSAEAGSPLLAVSNAMVKLYKEMFGRGPTKARAQFAGPDLVVVLLENTLTAAERNLVALGQYERLHELRLIAHHALEGELRSMAEQTLGRRALSVMSALDVHRDVSAELLTLEPLTPTAAV